MLHRQEMRDEAAACFEKALSLRPDSAPALNNLGSLEQDRGNYARAQASFERALEIEPRMTAAATNLGSLHQLFGRLDEARRLYARALEIDPAYPRALLNLVGLERGGITPEMIATMESLIEKPNLEAGDRGDLLFALARAHEHAANHRTAFSYAERGNRLERETRATFDAARSRNTVERTIAVFSPEFFERRAFHGSTSKVPIFIVGLPRSGTTLIEQILASHPQVYGGGELPELGKLVSDLGAWSRTKLPYPEGVGELDEPAALRLAGSYLATLRRLGRGAERVTYKMPFNFYRVGLIALLFPNARVIHCRRDPLDVFVSGYFLKFKRPIPYVCDQRDFVSNYADYKAVMEHWHRVVPSAIMPVQYEDFVARHEEVSRQMVEFCGLEWDERCLEFYANPRPVRTGSSVQVRRPIYTESVGRWRRYAEFLEPLIAALRETGSEGNLYDIG